MTNSDMKTCPYCAEDIKTEAIKCRYCGSNLRKGNVTETWYRIPEGKVIWGICTGLAHIFGVSVTFIRLAFVISTIFGGWGIIFYVVLRFLMPLKHSDEQDMPPVESV